MSVEASAMNHLLDLYMNFKKSQMEFVYKFKVGENPNETRLNEFGKFLDDQVSQVIQYMRNFSAIYTEELFGGPKKILDYIFEDSINLINIGEERIK